MITPLASLETNLISVSVAYGIVALSSAIEATFPSEATNVFVIPSRVTSYVAASFNSLNRVNVTLEASLESTVTLDTG